MHDEKFAAALARVEAEATVTRHEVDEQRYQTDADGEFVLDPYGKPIPIGSEPGRYLEVRWRGLAGRVRLDPDYPAEVHEGWRKMLMLSMWRKATTDDP